MKNLSLLFNKTYYDSLTAQTLPNGKVKKVFPDADKMNDRIFKTRFFHDTDYVEAGPMVNQSFLLTVCYPGMLIGIGNVHDSGAGDDEIGVGFSFDYVTGQPYIPGSTVKGVLRSHFSDHPEVIMSLYERDRDWVKTLEKEIFENTDVFFDAVVYAGDPYGKLLGAEYITPHKSPTENPVPIKLMKILPEVRFSFRFQLKDSSCMAAAEKAKLFQKLLCLFGVGAKTNVGFGVMRMDETDGHIAPVKAEPVNTAETAQRPQQRNGSSRPQQGNWQRPAAPSEPANQESKKCPCCGKWNKRFNPHTGRENYRWREGVCFNCGGRLS